MQQRRCQYWRLVCFRFRRITIEGSVHLSAGDRDATADVLIILRSAQLVVGEWKTSARGLTGDELDRLCKAADQVGARATFAATLDPARSCGPLWREQPRPTVGRTSH